MLYTVGFVILTWLAVSSLATAAWVWCVIGPDNPDEYLALPGSILLADLLAIGAIFCYFRM